MLAPPPRPLFYRAAATALPRLWRSGLLPPADLRLATLEAQARAATGLRDFGDDGFVRAQLAVLLPALRDEAELNPVGRFIAHGSMLKVLRERLWAEALFRRFPGIVDRPVVAPVVVVGQMRSGTTRVHRLLAADPQFASLRLFEALCPVPWPSSFRARRDPRIAWVRAGLHCLNRVNPAIGRLHPTAPLEVDEELGLLEASLTGGQIEVQRRVPGFARWNEGVDQTPAYAHLKRLLQLTGWFRGQDAQLPWLLKTPHHCQDLPALLRVFPDARLVFTRRDPVAVVSGATLVWHQMVVQSDAVDAAWVGTETLRKTIHRAAALAGFRSASPGGIDVDFAAVDADWRGEMRRVYARLGCDLTPAVEAAMALTIARHDARPRPPRHAAADFGLDAAALSSASPAAATRALAGAGDARGDSRRS